MLKFISREVRKIQFVSERVTINEKICGGKPTVLPFVCKSPFIIRKD